jgi:hypothetical protein
MKEYQKITHILGRLSATIIIPISLARSYGFDSKSILIVEERDEGILIKKTRGIDGEKVHDELY